MTDNISKNLPSKIGCSCWGNSAQSADAQPIFAEVGCRWVRSTRPMQMDTVTEGAWKYNFADNGERAIDIAIENGMSVMGIIDGRWGNETCFNDLPFASPIWEHLDQWEDFVRATVEFYRDRVKYWEIINEPPFFWWYPSEEGVHIPLINPPAHRASISNYVELLKVSARAIRAADPEAKIVVGSGFYDGQFLKKIYELGGREYFDIVSVHYLPCKHPEDFSNAYKSLRKVMADFNDSAKEVWDTENGPFGAVIGHAVATPDAYEALFNVYRHCFAHEFGLDRYFWFNPVQIEASVDKTFGLREADGNFTAPYQAMYTMTSILGDGNLRRVIHIQDEVHAYLFEGKAGLVTLLWSTAPATARLAQSFDAVDYLGNKLTIAGEFELDGRILFINGDILDLLEVTIDGPRETIVTPRVLETADTQQVTIPKAAGINGLDDPKWDSIPYVATHEEVPVTGIGEHVALISTSVSADLQLAWDDDALYLRARTYDDQLDANCPTGVVQFTIRDQNPQVREWSYFYNSYGIYSLYASPRGPMFLRFEHIDPLNYPPEAIAAADITVEPLSDGLRYYTRVLWADLGPGHPATTAPFFMQFTFNRADNLLDVPVGDTPEEWSHNFSEILIIKGPALTRRVSFDK